MLYNAKNKTIEVDGTPMSYVTFGYGKQALVLLPGLSDGLKTVRGQAINLAWYYRQFAKNYKVYIFSRKDVLAEGYTTKDMADDLKKALDMLNIQSIYLLGVSQGGMIAQHFAIHYPDTVKKLILVVSAARPNGTLTGAVSKWIDYAAHENYRLMMVDMLERTYTEEKLKKYRPVYPIISRMGKPKDLNRFLIQANACLTNNTYDGLDKIACPTLVVGGGVDKIVGSDAAQEIAQKINGCQLLIYEKLGHAAYEEAKDFNQTVLRFLAEA